MDETPGHAAEEPEKVTPGGAPRPPAGDPGPIEVFPASYRPLAPTTEEFLDQVVSHLTGDNPTEPMLDEAGNIVGIRIHPGRPHDYDTYLDRPASQKLLTYDDWAKLRSEAIPATSTDDTDGDPRAERILGRILRRLIDEGHVIVLDWANSSDLTVDGRIDITAEESALLRSIQFPRRP